MNIEQFEVFRTIAQAKSFTKAAKILNFTQPAISSQIKLLEQNYNVALFERGNNGVKLTEAGKKFYEYGEKILAIYADMESEISRISGTNKEFIIVGASYTAGNYFLPSSIITFKELHPEVHIRLDIGHGNEILEKIKNRTIDIGVVEGELAFDSEVNKTKIDSNELILIAPPTEKWIRKSSVDIETLKKEPFIAREEDSSVRHFIQSYLKSVGISIDDFNIITEITNWDAIKETVMRNKGIAIVPYPVVEREINEGRLIRVDVKGFDLTWDVEVVTRANEILSGLKKTFLDYLTDANAVWKAEAEHISSQKMRFI